MKPEHPLEKWGNYPSTPTLGNQFFAKNMLPAILFGRMKGVYLFTHPPIQNYHPTPVVLGSKV